MKIKIVGGLFVVLFVVLISCQSDQQIEFNRYYSGGSTIYQGHCQNCHGTKGEGLQDLIPPLTDTAYLKINKNNLTCFIKNGLKENIMVKGRLFEEEMPAEDLSPIEIAKVLTYITNSFGNKTGTIHLQQVENDIRKCK